MKYRNWMELGSAVPLPSVRPNRAVVCVNSVGPRANKEQRASPVRTGANTAQKRCEQPKVRTTKYELDYEVRTQNPN